MEKVKRELANEDYDTICELTTSINRLANAMETSTEVSTKLVEISQANVDIAKAREARSVNSGLLLVELTRDQLEFLRNNYNGNVIAEVTADQLAFLTKQFGDLKINPLQANPQAPSSPLE